MILLARRADRLTALQEELSSEYPDVHIHIVVMDVRDTPAIMALQEQLPPAFSQVDILVNNAGLALGTAAADEVCLDDARTMIECECVFFCINKHTHENNSVCRCARRKKKLFLTSVYNNHTLFLHTNSGNILAVAAFTKAFGAGMRQRNAGHIINMSSIAGKEFYSGGSIYCATKHAIEAMTGAARHDFVDTNVRVTSISPGAVKTEFSVVRFKGDEAKANAVYEGIVPLTAADIADNVLYAATRPPHVQIADILVFATYQCSAKGIARVLSS